MSLGRKRNIYFKNNNNNNNPWQHNANVTRPPEATAPFCLFLQVAFPDCLIGLLSTTGSDHGFLQHGARAEAC